jgi:hypothetical protein
MKMEYEVTVFRLDEETDKEIEINVVVERNTGQRGERDCYGVPLTPDDPVTYEIKKAFREDTKEEIELTLDEHHEAVCQAENDWYHGEHV